VPDQTFRLASDVSVDRPRFLVAIEPAQLAQLTRREPMMHPGPLTPAVFVGVRLFRGTTGMFERAVGER
jgi:hypothetical protein